MSNRLSSPSIDSSATPLGRHSYRPARFRLFPPRTQTTAPSSSPASANRRAEPSLDLKIFGLATKASLPLSPWLGTSQFNHVTLWHGFE
jgi:hypothetical protein